MTFSLKHRVVLAAVCLLTPFITVPVAAQNSRDQRGTVEENAPLRCPASNKLRFALALVQDQPVYSMPGVLSDPMITAAASVEVFKMPILQPFLVTDSRCQSTDVVPCQKVGDENSEEICVRADGGSGCELWYQIQAGESYGQQGWVPSSLVGIWNNRHALAPTGSKADPTFPVYCSRKDPTYGIKSAIQGSESNPCMTYNPSQVAEYTEASRSPLPVVDIEKMQANNGANVEVFHALMPTMYSNLVPMKKDSATGSTGVDMGVVEFIFMLDATGSMGEALAGTKAAVTSVINTILGMKNVKARFLVIAYRDRNGRGSMPIIEATGDKGGVPRFGDAEGAKKFLSSLQAGEGGDVNEAIWDAFYVLTKVQTSPGARRMLILVGDAPGHNKTQGVLKSESIPALDVPPGLKVTEVMAMINPRFGNSSSLLTIFFNKSSSADWTETRDQIMKGIPFLNIKGNEGKKSAESGDAVRKTILQWLNTELKETAADYDSVKHCQKMIGESNGDKFVFACGDRDKRPLTSRLTDAVRRSARGGDVAVIREFWFQKSSLEDVALMSVEERDNLADAFERNGKLIDQNPKKCREITFAEKLWIDATRPFVKSTVRGGSLSFACIQPAMWELWKRRFDQEGNSSVLSYQPKQITKFGESECRSLGNRMKRASQEMRVIRPRENSTFLWVPFRSLP